MTALNQVISHFLYVCHWTKVYQKNSCGEFKVGMPQGISLSRFPGGPTSMLSCFFPLGLFQTHRLIHHFTSCGSGKKCLFFFGQRWNYLGKGASFKRLIYLVHCNLYRNTGENGKFIINIISLPALVRVLLGDEKSCPIWWYTCNALKVVSPF